MSESERERQTVRSGNTVQIDTHAASTLRYIRASMDAAASLAVPGSAGISSGVIGVAAAVLSSVPLLQRYWLPIWLGAAVVAAGLGSILVMQQSPHQSLTLAGAPVRKFAIGLLPSLFAGAVMTAVHWSYGNLHAIPGTWLMLYGCGLIAASAAAARSLGILGGSFFVTGLAALLLPDSLQIAALGVGFGGLHMIFGLLTRRAGHGRES